MFRTLPQPTFLMVAWIAFSCSTSPSASVDAGRAGTGGSKTGTGGAGAAASDGASAAGGAGAAGSGGASGTGGAGAAGSGGASGTGGASGSGGIGAAGSGGASGTGGASATGGAGGTGARDGAVDSVSDAGAPGSDACVLPDAQASRLLDLNVRGEGFDVHNGRTIRVFTREERAGILGTASATIVAGGFSVRFPGGYVRNAPLQGVSWYVDEDGDGACNQAKGDDQGYRAVDPFDPPDSRALDLIVHDDHASSARVRGACDGTRPFEEMSDMDITATGFAAHDGATIRLLTRTWQNGAVFGVGQATIAGGKFSLHFPRAYQQFTYQEILWFVDIDGDGVCTIADHRGGVSSSAFTPTGSAAITMPITDNHTTVTARSADLCAVVNGCQLAP